MCANGWSVEQCTKSFERLAELAFQPRWLPPRWLPDIPLLSNGLNFLIWYLFDGRYPADNLEAALQETFGDDRSILDCSKATATGTRIGLPVTTIGDTSTCVFTNYNGVGERPADSGEPVHSSE